MHVVVFKDRCARAIRVVFDDARTWAVAYHDGETVGELRLDAECEAAMPVTATLARLYVETAYRRSGIAHTLLVYARRELGQPIRIEPHRWPESHAWATLCRCLAHEGIVAVA